MRIRRWVVLMILGVGPLVRADPADSRLSFADGLFRRGIYDLALREYFQFLQENPEHPLTDAVWFRSGECYRAMGNRSAAEQAWSRVTGAAGGPWMARAGLRRSEMLRETGRIEEAIALLRRVLDSDPPEEEAAEGLFRLADAVEKTGRPVEAIGHYERLVRQYSNSAYAVYAMLAEGTLRVVYSNEVERGEARLKEAAARASDPRVAAEAWYQLGLFYLRVGRFPDSAYALDQLLMRYGDDPRARAARLPAAWAFHRSGRHTDALRLAGEALGRADEPEQDTWLYLAANCERSLDKQEAAAERYGMLLARFPTSSHAARASLERAMALFAAGRYADAAVQCRAVDPTIPEMDRVLWIQAECAVHLGLDDQAVQYYQTLADRFRDSEWAPEALYRVGDLFRKRGNEGAAAETFRTLVARYPRTALAPKALFAAAYAASRAHRIEEAIRDWGLLLEQYPQHPLAADALFHKAMAEARVGWNEQALETYGLLLRRFPESPYAGEARYWRGVLQEIAGRLEAAVTEYRSALASPLSEEKEREARLRQGINLLRLKRFSEAADMIQSVLPTPLGAEITPALLEWLADYRLTSGYPDQALEAARLLTVPRHEPAWRQKGWYQTGRVLEKRGDLTTARKAYESALAEKAETEALAYANLRLGNLLAAAGAWSEAEPYYREAIGRSGEDYRLHAEATAGLARSFDARGITEEALPLFLKVALTYRDDSLTPECLYRAAEGFRKQGRVSDAERLLAELRQEFPSSSWAAKTGGGTP